MKLSEIKKLCDDAQIQLNQGILIPSPEYVRVTASELPRLVSLLENARLLLPQAASYVERYYESEELAYENPSQESTDPYLCDILRVANDLRALVKDIEGE